MSEDDDDTTFGLHLPTFVWAVRDFMLELKVDGRPDISPDEYLENSLNIKKGECTCTPGL